MRGPVAVYLPILVLVLASLSPAQETGPAPPVETGGAAQVEVGASGPPASGSVSPLQLIVIDPGHGGEDAGVSGPDGTEEKSLTLTVALRAKALIESRLGIRVMLTRDDDRTMGPDERTATANHHKADLFLSLHFNAAPVASVAGAEVFHHRLDREGEATRQASERDAVTLQAPGGATRTIEMIRWDQAQARHVDASAVLAGHLEAALRARVPMGTRPRREMPLRVLTSANMPAVLVEAAYLSNPDQEAAAQSEAFQDEVAQAIHDAVSRYRADREGKGPE